LLGAFSQEEAGIDLDPLALKSQLVRPEKVAAALLVQVRDKDPVIQDLLLGQHDSIDLSQQARLHQVLFSESLAKIIDDLGYMGAGRAETKSIDGFVAKAALLAQLGAVLFS